MIKYPTYFIVCTARTGSMLLCDWIGNAKVFGGPGEWWNRGQSPINARRWHTLPEYADILMEQHGNPMLGIKGHLTLVKPYIEHYGIHDSKYIFLRRCDLMRQAISLYRAQQTQDWHRRSDNSTPLAAPAFDRAGVIYTMKMLTRQNEMSVAFFEEHRLSPLNLFYEDIVEHPQQTMRTIAAHLDAPLPDGYMPCSNLQITRDDITEQWLEMI